MNPNTMGLLMTMSDREVRPIGHQTARFDGFAIGVARAAVADYERVHTDIKCVRAAPKHLESGRRLPL
jgi:hypothetical protein